MFDAACQAHGVGIAASTYLACNPESTSYIRLSNEVAAFCEVE